jgi:tetratricopeptide (TPR) repeat protein
MGASAEEFIIDAGSRLAGVLAAAQAASDGSDLQRMDQQYRSAVRLAGGDSATLHTAIAVEHISRLRLLGQSSGALDRCEEYLTGDGDNVRLRLVRAETDVARGDFSRIDTELAAIHRIAGGRPRHQGDDALLSRLEGLAAAHHGWFSGALQHLRTARNKFTTLGDIVAVRVVDDDIRAVAARRGEAVPDSLASTPGATPVARLARSEELRVVGRYEEALGELAPALEIPLDPAVRFFFLEAKVRLLRLLRADGEADALMPSLYQAAGASAQPEQNRRAAQRLELDCPAGPGAVRDRTLQHVRWLVWHGQLAEAERLLLAEPAPGEPDDRHAAEWHLAAGELTLAIANQGRAPVLARQAAGHLNKSIRHAGADSLVAIRVEALRLLGHAQAVLGEMAQAVEAWAAAHRLEESVAALQPSDGVQIRMLRAVPDEFDEQIQVAAHAIDLGEPLAAATVVVAMEAARGAAILPRILPAEEPRVRELPGPRDIAGARRWGPPRRPRAAPHSAGLDDARHPGPGASRLHLADPAPDLPAPHLRSC